MLMKWSSVFTGIEWIEDFGDETRPCFEIKWSAIQENEPMQEEATYG